MSLSSFIAKTGTNLTFVAFMAHAGVAYGVIYTLAQHLHGPRFGLAMVVAILAAAGKEFWFDATQEKDPPQTFEDNLGDFLGYMAGLSLAAGMHAHGI
jgi:hypothetical protein